MGHTIALVMSASTEGMKVKRSAAVIPVMTCFVFSCSSPAENSKEESLSLTEPPKDFQIDWTSEVPVVVPKNVFGWQPRDRSVVVHTSFESAAAFDHFQLYEWGYAKKRRGLSVSATSFRLSHRPEVRTLVALDLFEEEPLEFFECHTTRMAPYGGVPFVLWNLSDDSTFYCTSSLWNIEINVDAKTLPSDFDRDSNFDEYMNVSSKWKKLSASCLERPCARRLWVWTPGHDNMEVIDITVMLIPPDGDYGTRQPRLHWRRS